MPAATLIDLLADAAQRGTGGLRFVDRHEGADYHSWEEVFQRSRRAATYLRNQGVEAGARVAVVMPTSIGFFDALFGLLSIGAIPVPLYPPVRLGRLDRYYAQTAAMLTAVEARHVVSDRRVGRLLGEAVSRVPHGCRLLTLERLPEGSLLASHPASGDDLALIQFSSGTTVDPKPVALTHRALLAQVEALNQHWGHLPEASGVSWLPLYHDMGLIGCVFPAIDVAADLTLIPPELFVALPAIWLRTLSRYRGMISPAPNFAYGLCLEKIDDDELDGVDLSPWRIALNGAEAVSADVMRRFSHRFSHWGFRPEALSPVYGLSEASLAVTFSALDRSFTSLEVDAAALTDDRQALPVAAPTERAAGDDATLELVSVGRPLNGFEVELRSPGGDRLSEGRVGRLFVKGPSLMQGYFGRPDATRAALVDGWLDTGDEGFTHQGELYLTGRAKDLLILRGRNHSPEEVERALDGLDGVRTGCSAAVSHRPAGAASEVLVTLVELRRGVAATDSVSEQCRKVVLARTGLAIDRVELLKPGTLPRTSSGKIRRREALERLLAGTLKPPARVTWWRLLGALLRSRTALRRSSTP